MEIKRLGSQTLKQTHSNWKQFYILFLLHSVLYCSQVKHFTFQKSIEIEIREKLYRIAASL